MLVRFRSNAGDVTMFGKDALPLIRMMGHSGTVPSAILARNLPDALRNLKQGVATAPPPPETTADDPDEEPPVPLAKRAFPLIELLERCIQDNCDLLWEQQNPKSYL